MALKFNNPGASTAKSTAKFSNGLKDAIITGINDLGLQQSEYGSQEKIQIVTELTNENPVNGYLPQLGVFVTASMHKGKKTSKLRELMEGFKGRALTDTEANQFDIVSECLGKPCQVFVKNRTNSKGNTNSEIIEMMPARSGQSSIAEHELLVYDQANPDPEVKAKLSPGIQRMIDEGAANLRAKANKQAKANSAVDSSSSVDPIDDVFISNEDDSEMDNSLFLKDNPFV